MQGQPVDLGGYFHVDRAKTDEVMRPSATFNDALTGLSSEAGRDPRFSPENPPHRGAA